MTGKQKKNLVRILAALGLFLVLFITDKILNLGGVIGGNFGWLLPFALYLTVYLRFVESRAKYTARSGVRREFFNVRCNARRVCSCRIQGGKRA